MDGMVPNLADDGGVATIVLARDIDLPAAYANHAQVVALRVGAVPDTLPALSARVPANTRIVIIGGVPPQFTLGLVQKVCVRRSLPLVMHRHAPALADALQRILPPRVAAPVDADAGRWIAPAAVPLNEQPTDTAPTTDTATPTPTTTIEKETDDMPQKWTGTIRDFVATYGNHFADTTQRAEAERLWPLTKKHGVTTTIGSLTQAVQVARKRAREQQSVRARQSAKAQRSTKSAGMPPLGAAAERSRAVATDNGNFAVLFDQTIANLNRLRDVVAQRDAEIAELRRRLDAFKQLLTAD